VHIDVVVGPLLGIDPPLDGGVLRRQAEGIPADGIQDVEAAHAHEASDRVVDRKDLDVAHV
jgi:hypothetical protein